MDSAETIIFTYITRLSLYAISSKMLLNAVPMSAEDFGEKCILAKNLQQLLDRRDLGEKYVGERI